MVGRMVPVRPVPAADSSSRQPQDPGTSSSPGASSTPEQESQLQVIGMSATLPNVDQVGGPTGLAGWLAGRLFLCVSALPGAPPPAVPPLLLLLLPISHHSTAHYDQCRLLQIKF